MSPPANGGAGARGFRAGRISRELSGLIGEDAFAPAHGKCGGADAGAPGTGFPCIDEMIGGGQSPGEVYGLLGPYGSAKTTLAIQLAAEAARRCARRYRCTGSKDECAVYVSYEPGPRELKQRLAGYAVHLAGEANAALLLQEITPFLYILDYSAGGCAGMTGTPGLPLVAKLLGCMYSEVGAVPGFVAVDHLSAMAGAIDDENQDPRPRHQIVREAPQEAAQFMARPLDCPVWLVHQFTGRANERAAGADTSHHDADGTRDFGEGLDYALAIGHRVTRDDQQQLMSIRASKQKIHAPRSKAIITLRSAPGAAYGRPECMEERAMLAPTPTG